MIAFERSLRSLGIEFIDLHCIHRVGPVATVGAMSALVAKGKVCFLRISEMGPPTIRRHHATHPMPAVPIEYPPPWPREVVTGALDTCRELGIDARNPLQDGAISGA
jgi:aryl-alcohol dehydrogenase-like predicted oxidoreductase